MAFTTNCLNELRTMLKRAIQNLMSEGIEWIIDEASYKMMG